FGQGVFSWGLQRRGRDGQGYEAVRADRQHLGVLQLQSLRAEGPDCKAAAARGVWGLSSGHGEEGRGLDAVLSPSGRLNHMLDFMNRDRWRRWVPVPIRMILGVGFMVHGWAKWSRGPAVFAELLRQVDVPLPLANAWLVTLLEIVGGLALLIGVF